ncbi:hypothetical protein [Cryobacterium soli]|jgi:hypothetical protein|nr:hypothetical protein [Cryobacterium soli]
MSAVRTIPKPSPTSASKGALRILFSEPGSWITGQLLNSNGGFKLG